MLGNNWGNFGGGNANSGGFSDFSDTFSGFKRSATGTDKTAAGNIFEDIFGERAGNFSDFFKKYIWDSDDISEPRNINGAQDYEASIELSLYEAYTGSLITIPVLDQKLRIKIKAGITDGQTLKLKGRGGLGYDEKTRGDLFLTINVLQHPDFERDNHDLKTKIKVNVFTAILGGTATLKLLDGSEVNLKIPAGTNSGKTFRLKGKGMPDYHHAENFGDLYAEVQIDVPTHLSETQKQMLQKLAQEIR